VDGNFNHLTQRVYPKMSLIKTALECSFDTTEGDCLVLSAPGKNDLKVPIKPTNDKVECRCVFNQDFILSVAFIKTN
jgi:hypothetical protein